MKKHLLFSIAFGFSFCFANLATAQSFSISGTVQTAQNESLIYYSAVLLNSANAVVDSIAITNGAYTFQGLSPGTYQVRLSKSNNPLNGVSSFDMVLVSRHLLGIDPLDSPYKMLAADINRNGIISVWDIVYARTMILGLTNTFPDHQSWRFVRSDLSFGGGNPFQVAYGATNTVTISNSDISNFDFIGIKIFDVNSSAETSN